MFYLTDEPTFISLLKGKSVATEVHKHLLISLESFRQWRKIPQK
jgi:hypothetical protein